jgi:hypothetical protein
VLLEVVELQHLFLALLHFMLAGVVAGVITLVQQVLEGLVAVGLVVSLELLIPGVAVAVHQVPLCLLVMEVQALLSLVTRIYTLLLCQQPDRLLYTKQTVTGFIGLLVLAQLHSEVKHGEFCAIR